MRTTCQSIVASRPSTEGRLPTQHITIDSPGYASAKAGEWNRPDVLPDHKGIVLAVLEDFRGDRWLREVQWCGIMRRWKTNEKPTPFAVVAWRRDVASKPFLTVPTKREFPSVPFPPPVPDGNEYRSNPYRY